MRQRTPASAQSDIVSAAPERVSAMRAGAVPNVCVSREASTRQTPPSLAGAGAENDTAVLGRCSHHRHDASISSPPPDGLANEAVTSRSVAACNPAAIHETT